MGLSQNGGVNGQRVGYRSQYPITWMYSLFNQLGPLPKMSL